MLRTASVAFALVLTVAASVAAQEAVSATLSSSMPPLARLSLSANSLTFPDADPDLFPQVPSSGGPITITAKARAQNGGLVTLTLQASDDLRSGVDILPVSLITWTGSGPGFINGTMSRTSAQLVATWVGSGVRSGTQTFRFENRWTHPAGIYTVTLVYTLTAP